MYRPQFIYPPAGTCEYQSCVYSFDWSNTPPLGGSLAAGGYSGRIPLRLDQGADFLLRAIGTTGATGIVAMRLEDSDSNPLGDSDNANVNENFALLGEYTAQETGGVVAVESGTDGILLPAGGSVSLFVYNGAGSYNLTSLVVNLYGVKVYPGGRCS